MRISTTSQLGPDRTHPFGHAAEEALYSAFRSLALVGLVVFGTVQALVNILRYATGGEVTEILLGPIVIYMAVITTTCFALAYVHRSAWVRTGRKSVVLKLEMQAALYDGAISLGAGIGLLSVPFLIGTRLEVLTPVMDSILVMLLCLVAVGSYVKTLWRSMGELAGATAPPQDILQVGRAIRPVIAEAGGTVRDIAMVRMGRKLDAVVYYDPERSISPEEVDALNRKMLRILEREVGSIAVLIVISTEGRVLPDQSAA